MELLINLLWKFFEYFLDKRYSEKDSKKSVCQNLTKLYLLANEFKMLLQKVINSLETEVEPSIKFHKHGDQYHPSKKRFSRKDQNILRSHLSKQRENVIKNMAQTYTRLNKIRDEVVDIIVRNLPLQKLALIDAMNQDKQIEANLGFESGNSWLGAPLIIHDSIIGMLAIDNPTSSVSDNFIINSDNLAIEDLGKKKISLHKPLIEALISHDKWDNYVSGLRQSNYHLNELTKELRRFIKENCDSEDIL